MWKPRSKAIIWCWSLGVKQLYCAKKPLYNRLVVMWSVLHMWKTRSKAIIWCWHLGVKQLYDPARSEVSQVQSSSFCPQWTCCIVKRLLHMWSLATLLRILRLKSNVGHGKWGWNVAWPRKPWGRNIISQSIYTVHVNNAQTKYSAPKVSISNYP